MNTSLGILSPGREGGESCIIWGHLALHPNLTWWLLCSAAKSPPAVLRKEQCICPLAGLLLTWSVLPPLPGWSQLPPALPKCTCYTKCHFSTMLLGARLRCTAHIPRLQKPRNTKSFALKLSADSWISQRCIIASFHPSLQYVNTHCTFARKRPVIGFARGTTSEINAVCTIIYLPRACVVFLSGVPVPVIAQLSHPESRCGDGGAVRAISSWKRCIVGRGGRLLSRQTDRWLPHQFAPPFHEPPFWVIRPEWESFKKKSYLAVLICIHEMVHVGTESHVQSAPSAPTRGNQATSPGIQGCYSLWSPSSWLPGSPLSVISPFFPRPCTSSIMLL